jgi:uncharacterized protein (DUF1810 family)
MSKESAAVLQAILNAQEKGLGTKRNPPFAVACEEIREGAKKSHWIWYVWPSLCDVRGGMRPELVLPNCKAVCAYLQQPLLAERLLEVSSLACEHLENGVAPAVLFGSMHHTDTPQFYEAMSMFAIAAHLNGDHHQRRAFVRGVLACGFYSLDGKVVETFLKEMSAKTKAAVASISRILSDAMPHLDASGSTSTSSTTREPEQSWRTDTKAKPAKLSRRGVRTTQPWQDWRTDFKNKPTTFPRKIPTTSQSWRAWRTRSKDKPTKFLWKGSKTWRTPIKSKTSKPWRKIKKVKGSWKR